MFGGMQAALCTLAVQELAGLSHAELATLLPTSHIWNRAGAAVCLLSNLLEAGGQTLEVRSCSCLSSHKT